MQETKTIHKGLEVAHRLIWDDLGLDCSEITEALTALNQLEQKLNKEIDRQRQA